MSTPAAVRMVRPSTLGGRPGGMQSSSSSGGSACARGGEGRVRSRGRVGGRGAGREGFCDPPVLLGAVARLVVLAVGAVPVLAAPDDEPALAHHQLLVEGEGAPAGDGSEQGVARGALPLAAAREGASVRALDGRAELEEGVPLAASVRQHGREDHRARLVESQAAARDRLLHEALGRRAAAGRGWGGRGRG